MKGFFDITGVTEFAIDRAGTPLTRLILAASAGIGMVVLMGLMGRKMKPRWCLVPWLRSIVIAPGTGIAYVSSQKSLYELHYAHRK